MGERICWIAGIGEWRRIAVLEGCGEFLFENLGIESQRPPDCLRDTASFMDELTRAHHRDDETMDIIGSVRNANRSELRPISG